MNFQEKAKVWTQAPFDSETQEEVKNLIENDPKVLEDSFYKDLEFGTGGMRGIMGVGTNRLNKYTYGQATQGLSNYLLKKFPTTEIKVAIAYDVRNNSDTFSKLVADILTANGIKVFLFEGFRPTPELSFAIRELECQAGLILTASHNPPEYNGLKVYFEDGGQIVPPEDGEIIAEVQKVEFSAIKFQGNENLIEYIGEEIDQKFIQACIDNTDYNAIERDNLKIVFTPLHGTAIAITPEALQKAGFKRVFLVEKQIQPSGNFPTVVSPNPEEPEALKMALEMAEDIEADIVMGTDPDADRIGVAVRDLKGEMIILNGNQTNTILTYFLLNERKEKGLLKPTDFIGSTNVTSDIFYDMANYFGVEVKVGLTGFKWIAKMIKDHPEQQFICGGEESFGFMVGDFVRDKDSVSTALLVAEVAAIQKAKGKTLFQYLIEIYEKIGFYYEELISITKKGKEGAEEINRMMKEYRENPFKEIAGETTAGVEDFLISKKRHFISGGEGPIHTPKSNVLIFYTDKETKVAARPSGTEPKIKYYFSVKRKLEKGYNFEETFQEMKDKIEELKEIFKN